MICNKCDIEMVINEDDDGIFECNKCGTLVMYDEERYVYRHYDGDYFSYLREECLDSE